jgi:hypothetical protein
VNPSIYDYSGIKKDILNSFVGKKVLFINVSKFDGAVSMAECVLAIKEIAASYTVLDASHMNNYMKKNRLKPLINLIESLQVRNIFFCVIDKNKYKKIKSHINYRKKLIVFNENEEEILKTGLMNSSADGFFSYQDINSNISRISKIYENFYEIIANKNYDTVVTYNGRFLIPSIIYILSKKLDKQIYFIEGGAQSNSYEIYNLSPHSHSNRAELALQYWKYADTESARILCEEYLNKRVLLKDEILHHNYQSRFDNITNKVHIEKYRGNVIFYLSSLWELPSVAFNYNELFCDQESAILVLQQICDKNKLVLTIKIHPNPHNPIFEKSENEYWEKFLTSHGIGYISAFDTINTYSLMKTAFANVVYESSVGAECIALNFPVIALAKSDWLISSRFPMPKNIDEVEYYLLNPKLNYGISNLMPYFLYLQFSGIPYEKFQVSHGYFLHEGEQVFKGAFRIILAIFNKIKPKNKYV